MSFLFHKKVLIVKKTIHFFTCSKQNRLNKHVSAGLSIAKGNNN